MSREVPINATGNEWMQMDVLYAIRAREKERKALSLTWKRDSTEWLGGAPANVFSTDFLHQSKRLDNSHVMQRVS